MRLPPPAGRAYPHYTTHLLHSVVNARSLRRVVPLAGLLVHVHVDAVDIRFIGVSVRYGSNGIVAVVMLCSVVIIVPLRPPRRGNNSMKRLWWWRWW